MISWSFSNWCRGWSRSFLLPVAKFFGKLGLTPNKITILGLFSYGLVGLVLGCGHPTIAGCLLAVLGPLDAVDGLLARETGAESSFGAFLDSSLDRLAEFFLFLGLLVYLFLYRAGGLQEAVLVLTALTGSLMVSYTRARAEALGFECKVGFLTRFERLFLLAIGLIFSFIFPVLVFLAFFTHITAIHRMIHVYRQSRFS